jgi:lysophospholipase L1-like esterase
MSDLSDWSRHVYPHGELTQLNERLWVAWGSLPRLPISRNMYVYKLDDGGLLVFSSVALNEAGMRELDALGPVRLILVPSHFHRMQASAYLERYPEALVVCPAAARDHVAKAVTVHGAAEEVLPKHGVIYHQPAGVKPREGVYEFPLANGHALLFCDALFNVPHQPGLSGLFMRLIGSTGFFGVTRIAKTFILSNRRAYAGWLEEQSRRSELQLIGVGHGKTISEACCERLAQASARLSGGAVSRRALLRRRFKLGCLLFALVGLVGGEVACRIWANESSRFNMFFLGGVRVFHPERRVALAKNYVMGGRQLTNSRGFMGPEFEPKKAPGTFRVACLGDSCTVVPYGDPYPRALERRLQTLSDQPVEVINAGCGGYSSLEAHHWYTTEVADYDHDALVIFLGWNDMGQFNPDGLGFKLERAGYGDQLSFSDRVFVHSYLARGLLFALGHVERRLPVSKDPLKGEDASRYDAYYPSHFAERLEEIVRLAEGKGRKVFLLNYAGLVTPAPTPDEESRMHFPRGLGRSLPKYLRLLEVYERVLNEVVAKTGATLIDVRALFATPEQRQVFTDSCHFDARGSSQIAELVAEHLAPLLSQGR